MPGHRCGALLSLEDISAGLGGGALLRDVAVSGREAVGLRSVIAPRTPSCVSAAHMDDRCRADEFTCWRVPFASIMTFAGRVSDSGLSTSNRRRCTMSLKRRCQLPDVNAR